MRFCQPAVLFVWCKRDALSLHSMWGDGEALRTVLMPGCFSFVLGASTLIILRENDLPAFLGRCESIPSADDIPMVLAEGESKPPSAGFPSSVGEGETKSSADDGLYV